MIELIVVIMLCSACAVFLLSSNFLSLRISQSERVRFLIIKNVVEAENEYLRSLPFDALTVGAPVTNFTDAYAISHELSNPGTYPEVRMITARQYTIAWVDSPTNSNLKRITVEVTWIDGSGHSRTEVNSTVIARPTS